MTIFLLWRAHEQVPAHILRNITLIDSPGILSGEKQRLGRDYDYQVRPTPPWLED